MAFAFSFWSGPTLAALSHVYSERRKREKGGGGGGGGRAAVVVVVVVVEEEEGRGRGGVVKSGKVGRFHCGRVEWAHCHFHRCGSHLCSFFVLHVFLKAMRKNTPPSLRLCKNED